jgi:hypothetical protein
MLTISLDPPLLDFYGEASAETALTVDEFESLGRRRAQLYQKILALLDTESTGRVMEELQGDLGEDFPLETAQDRAADNRAHFVLRLCCGSAPDLGDAFVKCEAAIFEARVRQMDAPWQQQFVDRWLTSRFAQEDVPAAEAFVVSGCDAGSAAAAAAAGVAVAAAVGEGVGDAVSAAFAAKAGVAVVRCWVVPFEECPELVAARAVRLRGGDALVPVTSVLFAARARARAQARGAAPEAGPRHGDDDDGAVAGAARRLARRGTLAFSLLRQRFA